MCKRLQHMDFQPAKKNKTTASEIAVNKTNIATLQRQLNSYIDYANNKVILRYSRKTHKYYLGHSRRWNKIRYFIRKNKWKKYQNQNTNTKKSSEVTTASQTS